MNYLYILDFIDKSKEWDEKLHNIIDPLSKSPVFWGCFFLGGLALFLAYYDSVHKGGK